MISLIPQGLSLWPDFKSGGLARAGLSNRNSLASPKTSETAFAYNQAGDDYAAYADGSIDIALCLYCVLNHLPVSALDAVVKEFSRVTRGVFMTTVRPLGSLPPCSWIQSKKPAFFRTTRSQIDLKLS